MNRQTRIVITAAVCVWAALSGRIGWADCGSIPFYAPALHSIDLIEQTVDAYSAPSAVRTAPELKFDPLKVSVFEPKQRALICWNGKEEILLLSTDQKATQQSFILEVMPLPAKPEVRLGSFETFEKAQKLVVEKRMWAVAHGGARAGAAALPESAGRVAFQKKLGAHDLTVAESLDSKGFVSFVQGLLQKQYGAAEAPIRPEFVQIIQDYLDNGFRWFAFDVISLNDSAQSRQPIEYRFESDQVFYPLHISRLERGKTEVELLVFTSSGATVFEGKETGKFTKQDRIDLTGGEFETLDKAWKGFFGNAKSLSLDQWTINADLSKFVHDVRAR